jgi:hypothetical protein
VARRRSDLGDLDAIWTQMKAFAGSRARRETWRRCFVIYGERLRRREGSTGRDVATRREEQQQSYRDLRERTKRSEHSREERMERIVELQRER